LPFSFFISNVLKSFWKKEKYLPEDKNLKRRDDKKEY